MRTTRFRGTGGTAGTGWRRTCRPHWSREDFGRIEKTCVLARHESRKLHPFRACRDPKDSYRIPTAYEYCAVLREEAKTLVSLADNSGRLPVQQHSRDRRTDWNDTSQKMETTEAFLHNFVYLLQNLIDIKQTSLRNTNRIENINVLSEGEKQLCCSGPVAVYFLCSGSPQKRNWFEAWFGSKLSVQQSMCVMPNSFESCFCFGGFWWHKIAEETSKLRLRNWSPDSLTAPRVVFCG